MQKIKKSYEKNLRYGQIGQKFDLLTSKIMPNRGQNYQIYTSL